MLEVLTQVGTALAGFAAAAALLWTVYDRRQATRPQLHLHVDHKPPFEKELGLLNASTNHAFEVEFQLQRVVVAPASVPRLTRWQRLFRTHLTVEPSTWTGPMPVHQPSATVRAHAVEAMIRGAAERVLDRRANGGARESQYVSFRCRVVITYRGGARRETYSDAYTVTGAVGVGERSEDGTQYTSVFFPATILAHRRQSWPDWISPRRSWEQFRYRG